MRKVVLSNRAKTKLENLLLFLETEWSLSVKNEFIESWTTPCKLFKAILKVFQKPQF